MIISTIGECALKKNLPHLFFYVAILISLIFYLCSFSQPFTDQRTAGEEGGHFFNSSVPLPAASQTLSLISRAITAESSLLHRGSNRTGNNFSIHGSGEIFPLINDSMICKYISYKCLRKTTTVLHYSYIM